jgi:hypothetical protein
MKGIAVFIVLLTLAIGTYLNKMDKSSNGQVMVEDSVESSMAAPVKPEIPL